MRRGPSELNVSTRLPVLNGCGNAAPACLAARQRTSAWAAVDEISFPNSGRAGVEVARIAGGRKIQRTTRRNVLHRLDHHPAVGVGRPGLTVLERRLDEVEHVVHDDVAAR